MPQELTTTAPEVKTVDIAEWRCPMDETEFETEDLATLTAWAFERLQAIAKETAP